jgi:peptidyl-prolyl cis-trans isomerase SurA
MHRLLKAILPALLLAALLPAGANAAEQAQTPLVPLDRIAAIVDNGVITLSQLQERTTQIKAELQARGTQLPSDAVLERQVLNSMILNKIQLGIADLNGIRIDDQTFNDALARLAQQNNLTVAQMHDRIVAEGHSWASFTQQLRDHLTIQKLQQRSVDQNIRVTNQEVRDFLAQHANQLDPGLQFHLAQILIPIPGAASPEQIKSARSEAEKLRKQAEAGENFAKLAVAHSAGPHALDGGALGWLSADQLPTYFVHVVNVMQSGEISQPIRSPSGFHLVKLLGVRGGKQVTITQTHVRHILIKITPTMSSAQARAKLERLRREIEQGASFATLAKANSDDTGSAVNGGDLGWVSPGQMVPQFQKMMNETPVGKISQPFRTPYGWHILEVLGRRQHDSTEQMVQARAKEIIFQRKRQEALNVWLRRIRDEAYVRILLKQNAG